MSCEALREKILDRIVDEMTEEEAIVLEQHLEDCQACSLEERRLRTLLMQAGGSEEVAADPAMADRLARALKDRRAPSRPWSVTATWRRPAPVYAALLFALVASGAGFLAGQRVAPSRPRAGSLDRPLPEEWLRPGPDDGRRGPMRFASMPADAFPVASSVADDTL